MAPSRAVKLGKATLAPGACRRCWRLRCCSPASRAGRSPRARTGSRAATPLASGGRGGCGGRSPIQLPCRLGPRHGRRRRRLPRRACHCGSAAGRRTGVAAEPPCQQHRHRRSLGLGRSNQRAGLRLRSAAGPVLLLGHLAKHPERLDCPYRRALRRRGAGAGAGTWSSSPPSTTGRRPFGTFAAEAVFTTPEWRQSENTDFDVAALLVKPNRYGTLSSVVGSRGYETGKLEVLGLSDLRLPGRGAGRRRTALLPDPRPWQRSADEMVWRGRRPSLAAATWPPAPAAAPGSPKANTSTG